VVSGGGNAGFILLIKLFRREEDNCFAGSKYLNVSYSCSTLNIQ